MFKFTSEIINSWQQKYPRLPFMIQKVFTVSSFKKEGVIELLKILEGECNKIFASYCLHIPSSYREVLKSIQTHPYTITSLESLHKHHSCGMDQHSFKRVIKYLNAIGYVVYCMHQPRSGAKNSSNIHFS
jgi:hypothetical protein